MKNVDLLVYFLMSASCCTNKKIGLFHIRNKKRRRNIIAESIRIRNNKKKKCYERRRIMETAPHVCNKSCERNMSFKATKGFLDTNIS